MTMTHERTLKIIEILLLEGSSGFFKEFPKDPEENYCCVVNNDIYIYFCKEWIKIPKKDGLTIWNRPTQSLFLYFETGNIWKQLETAKLKQESK